MRGLFNKTLGASLCAPFVPKCNGLAAMGAGLDMLGGLIQMSNTNAQNQAAREYDWMKTNDLMFFSDEQAEKARQHQSELLKNQQDWNERYYQLYNSPSAMRKQLEEAGYHSYLAADSQPNVGSVPSTSAPSSSVASAPSTGNPPMLPVNANFLSGAVDAYLRAKSVNADASNQSAQALNHIAELIPMLHKIGMSDEDIRKIVEPFIKSSQGINYDTDLLYKSAKVQYLTDSARQERERLNLDLAKRFSPKERQAILDSIDQQITESVARIGLMATQGKLNDKECEHLSQDIVESLSRIYKNYAEGSKQDIEGYQLLQFMPYLESELKRSANKAELEDEETFGNQSIRKFDKTLIGKGLNTVLWYLNRAFGSTNTGINVNARIPTGK